MKTANVVLRKYTRRRETSVEFPNMQSGEEIYQYILLHNHLRGLIYDFFKMEKNNHQLPPHTRDLDFCSISKNDLLIGGHSTVVDPSVRGVHRLYGEV